MIQIWYRKEHMALCKVAHGTLDLRLRLDREVRSKLLVREYGVSSNLEMGDRAFEEIRFRLEVSIKDGNKLIILYVITLHGRFQVARLVSRAVQAVSIHNVDSSLMPLAYLAFYQHTSLRIRRVVQDLNQNAAFRPIQLTHC